MSELLHPFVTPLCSLTVLDAVALVLLFIALRFLFTKVMG